MDRDEIVVEKINLKTLDLNIQKQNKICTYLEGPTCNPMLILYMTFTLKNNPAAEIHSK